MLLCIDCRNVFDDDELEVVYEKHPYGDYYAYEAWGVCPRCGSSNCVEARQCHGCGEYCESDDLQLSDDDNLYCAECVSIFLLD